MMYIECYADEKLIRALGVSRRNYDHIGDIGGVSRLLQKHGNSLGMIDEDPGKTYPTYFKKLPVKDSKHGLKTLYDEELNNLIVVMCPRLEE